MSLPFFKTTPLDPNLYTGLARIVSGPARTGSVTYDTGYTNSTTPAGVLEFATWLYVGTSGNLAYTKWDGTTETLPSLAAGMWHQIYSVNVLTTGTTIAANQLRWGS
jgi:hypothetical protein